MEWKKRSRSPRMCENKKLQRQRGNLDGKNQFEVNFPDAITFYVAPLSL
jgi:hypothetical protein